MCIISPTCVSSPLKNYFSSSFFSAQHGSIRTADNNWLFKRSNRKVCCCFTAATQKKKNYCGKSARNRFIFMHFIIKMEENFFYSRRFLNKKIVWGEMLFYLRTERDQPESESYIKSWIIRTVLHHCDIPYRINYSDC